MGFYEYKFVARALGFGENETEIIAGENVTMASRRCLLYE